MLKKLLSNKRNLIRCILIVVVILLTVISLFLVFKKNHKNPDESDLISNFNFELISSRFEDSTSTFEYKITNISKKKRYLNEFKVHVFDKSEIELVSLYGVVESDIESGESVIATVSYGGDLSKFDSFEYEIEK